MCEKTPIEFCNCEVYVPKNLTCTPVCHHLSICKLRKILEEPLSKTCFDLQEHYLKDYVEASKYGFYLNDMPYLTRVLEILAERITTTRMYRKYLKELLKLSALVPLVHDDTEKVLGIVHFGEYMSILGLLAIWLTEQPLRLLVYKALFQLITNKRKPYLNTLPLNFRHSATENSHLPEIATQLIEIASTEEYMEILKISFALTQISELTCQKMVTVGAMDYLLLRLLPDQYNVGPHILQNLTQTKDFIKTFDITCQILINFITSLKNVSDKKLLDNIAPKANSIWAIRYVLRALLYGKYTQLSRNNLIEFIIICMDIFPYLQITECFLVNDLAKLSVATELVNKDDWLKDIKFTNNEYDVYFKKMLLMALCFIEKYPAFIMIFKFTNVIEGLVKIVSQDYTIDWHSNDVEVLKKYALIALYHIAPLLLDNFIKHDGHVCLLINIESYILWPEEHNKDNLHGSLKVLFKCLETKHEKLIDYTRYHSGISVCIMLCNNILNYNAITFFDQEILSYCFTILVQLFKNVPLQNDVSIPLLIKYFHRIINRKSDDTCLNPRTVIAAIDYLWEIILFDTEKLKMFIKMEGVYLLLDIIDMSSFSVQVIGLGCLVDICEDGLCIPFLLTWRGGPNKRDILFSMLARIFRYECKKIGTRLNANDIIIDIYSPLMGKKQYIESLSPDKDYHSSASIADMLGSARPKIYALIQLLNTRYKEKVEIINEHYKICNAPLSRNDIIILHLAKNFFALKLSESWHELSQDLQNSNVVPINVDAEMLLNLTEKMQKWNESVQKEQNIIYNTEIKKETDLELQLYQTVRQCRLQTAIDALRELKYFATTTDHMFRKAHKLRQRIEIGKSEKEQLSQMRALQKTFMSKLNVTSIYNMNFSMELNSQSKHIVEK